MEIADLEEETTTKMEHIPDISRVSLNEDNTNMKPPVRTRPTWNHKSINHTSNSNNSTTVQHWPKPRPQFNQHSPSDSSPSDRTKAMKSSNKVPSVISLNVGGVYYTTLRTTLLRYPDSMLAAMFSGRHELQLDSRGASFIDRNGTYFGYILEFLRTSTLPPNECALNVLMEARYYGLEELEDRMVVVPSISALIVKENHRAQFPDYQENKKRIIQIAMENATVSKTGEVLIYAFRTEFVPRAPNFNINHHCSADQAHISIGPWESIADEETLIKCLESDLIDEHFNVRVHEGKRRCKYFYGQSCQKCLFRIQIVFG